MDRKDKKRKEVVFYYSIYKHLCKHIWCFIDNIIIYHNSFYLHEVADADGNLYYRLNEKENASDAFLTQPVTESPASADPAQLQLLQSVGAASPPRPSDEDRKLGVPTASDSSIANQEETVNSKMRGRKVLLISP